MKKNKNLDHQKKWDLLLNFITKKFGNGEKLDLQAILFLIGINELGQGYKNFTKEEQMNLLHIAICRLLSNYGYYTFIGKDDDGWPHWKTNNSLTPLNSDEQDRLLQEAAVLYFQEAEIEF